MGVNIEKNLMMQNKYSNDQRKDRKRSRLLLLEGGSGLASREALLTSVHGVVSDFLPERQKSQAVRHCVRWKHMQRVKDVLDTEKLVVLGNTLASGRGTSLDLTNTKSDDEVGDERVLGLAGAVRDHDTPAVGLAELSTRNISGKGQHGLFAPDANPRTAYAWIDSETVPIWLTLSRRPLHDFFSMAVLMRSGLVTVKSSPTTWMGVLATRSVHSSQSSCSKGSSMEMIGYFSTKPRYRSASSLPVILCEPSLSAYLKLRS